MQKKGKKRETSNFCASEHGRLLIKKARSLYCGNDLEIIKKASHYIYQECGQTSNLDKIAPGCSLATFRRFREGNPVRYFKVFCHVLGLNWQDVAALSCSIDQHLTINPMIGSLTLPGVSPPTQSSKSAITGQIVPKNSSQISAPQLERSYRIPQKRHTQLFGRDQELAELSHLLQPSSNYARILLWGESGIGKTALVLELLHQLVAAYTSQTANTSLTSSSQFPVILNGNQPQLDDFPDSLKSSYLSQLAVSSTSDFNAQHILNSPDLSSFKTEAFGKKLPAIPAIPVFHVIVFVSLSPYHSVGLRQIPKWRSQDSINIIERELAYALYPQRLPQVQLQREDLFTELSTRSVLLILDDFDQASHPDEILALLYGLPFSVKTILTTRKYHSEFHRTIALHPLSPDAACAMLRQGCHDREVDYSLAEAQTLIPSARESVDSPALIQQAIAHCCEAVWSAPPDSPLAAAYRRPVNLMTAEGLTSIMPHLESSADTLIAQSQTPESTTSPPTAAENIAKNVTEKVAEKAAQGIVESIADHLSAPHLATAFIVQVEQTLSRLDDETLALAQVLSYFVTPVTVKRLAAITGYSRAIVQASCQKLERQTLAHWSATTQTWQLSSGLNAIFVDRDTIAVGVTAAGTAAGGTVPGIDKPSNAPGSPSRSLRARWVAEYIELVRPLAAQDWKVWQDYQPLEHEWQNWLAVLEWCVQHDRYTEVCQLWAGVRGYTYFRGCWKERQHWLTWLIQAAEQRQDLIAIAGFLRDQAWTLMLMGTAKSQGRALELLDQAQNLVLTIPNFPQQAQFLVDLILERVVFYLESGEMSLAQEWLMSAKRQLLKARRESESRSAVSSRLLAWKRSKVRFQYYQAEVYFRLQNYEQARSIYSEVFKQARSLKWQQMRTYAANWLAEIALQEKQYETAQSFIFAAIEAIQEYDDPRSRGFLHRSEAKAKAHYATWQEAQAAAQLAIDAFARVGLLDQVHELKHDYQLA